MKTGHNQHRSVEQARQDDKETTDTISNLGLMDVEENIARHGSFTNLFSPAQKKFAFSSCLPTFFRNGRSLNSRMHRFRATSSLVASLEVKGT